MKKIIMALVCLMTMVMSVNAQISRNEAIMDAIRVVRSSLKAPSTFILTNRYGEKISVNKVNAKLIKSNVKYEIDFIYDLKTVTDSIDYIYGRDSILIDSIVYTSREICKDSIMYLKVTYPTQYDVSFYYEAQNSYGGMVQNLAYYYVSKNEIRKDIIRDIEVIKIEKYQDAKIENRNIKKNIIYKPGLFKRRKLQSPRFEKYDAGALLKEIKRLNNIGDAQIKNMERLEDSHLVKSKEKKRGYDDVYFK